MFHSGARRLAALLAVSVIWVGCKGKETETAPVPPVSSAVPPFKVSKVRTVSGQKELLHTSAAGTATTTVDLEEADYLLLFR